METAEETEKVCVEASSNFCVNDTKKTAERKIDIEEIKFR